MPRRTIREALINAVTHRDYAITGSKVMLEVFDRRVDVTSPGTLPRHMTVERVRAGASPRPRNESLAHFMAGMGFIKERGRGWLTMREQIADRILVMNNGREIEKAATEAMLGSPRGDCARMPLGAATDALVAVAEA